VRLDDDVWICEYAIPTAALRILRDEILGELARISHSGTLPPQGRTLLRLQYADYRQRVGAAWLPRLTRRKRNAGY
jgi:hypothetical protein